MSRIYGGASSVCIWIGEADKDSKAALDFIKNEVLRLQDLMSFARIKMQVLSGGPC
jgi:hypothetical protein